MPGDDNVTLFIAMIVGRCSARGARSRWRHCGCHSRCYYVLMQRACPVGSSSTTIATGGSPGRARATVATSCGMGSLLAHLILTALRLMRECALLVTSGIGSVRPSASGHGLLIRTQTKSQPFAVAAVMNIIIVIAVCWP